LSSPLDGLGSISYYLPRVLKKIFYPAVQSGEDTFTRQASASSSPLQSAVMRDVNYPFQLFGTSLEGGSLHGSAQEVLPLLAHAKTIALGDLHGSHQKLMETLLATNLIRMPEASQRQYTQLSMRLNKLVENDLLHQGDLYIRNPKSKDEAQKIQRSIKTQLETIQWNGGEDRQLILIGDVVADRGPLDSITLDILEKIKDQHPHRVVILASNHDHDGFGFLVKKRHEMKSAFVGSQKRAFETSEDKAALEAQYKRHSRESSLMHYDAETETLYTHAPITMKNMESLTGIMKQHGYLPENFKLETMRKDGLKDLTEQANTFYRNMMEKAFEQKRQDLALEKTLACRRNGFLWRRGSYRKPQEIPFYQRGVSRLVHGHDKASQRSNLHGTIVYNLDQNTRKDMLSPETDYNQPSRLYLEGTIDH
jgi:hypothetical protein